MSAALETLRAWRAELVEETEAREAELAAEIAKLGPARDELAARKAEHNEASRLVAAAVRDPDAFRPEPEILKIAAFLANRLAGLKSARERAAGDLARITGNVDVVRAALADLRQALRQLDAIRGVAPPADAESEAA